MGTVSKGWAGALAAVLLISGCSDDADDSSSERATTTVADEAATTTTSTDDGGADPTTTVPNETTTTAAAPILLSELDLSAATLESLDGAGAGTAHLSDAGLDPSYVETEQLLAGVANTYSGPATGPAEVATEDNAYATRLLVRMPADPADFSGRVVVEPFNTSGGPDADPVWGYLGDMFVAQGDAWIGVSNRFTSQTNLQEFDPERYAGVSIPSNGEAWDMLSQIGGLLREGGERSPLGDTGIAAHHVYMAGYSQNGIDTATYASTFGELARMSDGSAIYAGYLPLAHSGSISPLDSGQAGLPAFEIVPFGTTDVPVIDVESETDVLGFSDPAYTSASHAAVRRDDSDEPGDLYRLYEIPGASHAPTIPGCDHDGTTFPLQFFLRAAYRHLIDWAESGIVPPRADRMSLTSIDTVAVAERDEHGNALGGVRSPFLDVPVSTYQGNDTGSVICNLAGVEIPLEPALLDELYDGLDDYLAQFATELDVVFDDGFLLAEDEASILAYAEERAAPLLG